MYTVGQLTEINDRTTTSLLSVFSNAFSGFAICDVFSKNFKIFIFQVGVSELTLPLLETVQDDALASW